VKINYSIDAAKKLVTYTVEGTPEPEDFKGFFDSVVQEPRFERGFSFLGDCRGLAIAPDPTLVRSVASQLRGMAERLGPCKWAYLFSSAGGFAAVRVWSLLTQGTGIEFSSFLERTDAENWLGVECSGIPETSVTHALPETDINYLLDIRRRPGSGLHPQVTRRPR
jgi:hypothetical protein